MGKVKDKILEELMGASERRYGDNSVEINKYVSKIKFNLTHRTIMVYGKKGKILWGVTEGANPISVIIEELECDKNV